MTLDYGRWPKGNGTKPLSWGVAPGYDEYRRWRKGATQVPCTFNCKVNSKGDLRQHFPQRVVLLPPRYAESRQSSPELLAAPGTMHPELHARVSIATFCPVMASNSMNKTSGTDDA